MAQENYRKIKLLKLLDMLRHETDEQHPLTTTQICTKQTNLRMFSARLALTPNLMLLHSKYLPPERYILKQS